MKRTIAGIATVLSVGTGATFAADRAQDPYTDKGTHYELPITSDIPQGQRVEIAKNKAEITLKGWNDEYAITVTPQIPTSSFGATDRPFTVQADRPLLSKKMEYKSGDVTAFIEPKQGTENEFDIDFTLDAKPDTNIFTYKIEGAEDFDFFYQPELSPEEIAEGSYRPENVIGSYAVYHKTKANHRIGSTNYATGKAFHIYRPKAIDANAAETWAELNYENGTLSVTVPQTFLDDAVYPVIVDPTLGITGIGATTYSNEVNDGILATAATMSESGTITSISVYVPVDSADDGAKKWGIYQKDSVSSGNHGFIIGTTETTSPAGNNWITLNTTASPTLNSGTVYYPSAWGEETALKYDTGTGTYLSDVNVYGASWPDPLTATNFANFFLLSIYATYTASGGSTPAATGAVRSGAVQVRSGEVRLR